MTITLSELQQESKPWRDRNFPGHTSYQQILGVVEEVGELAHAHLKMEQGIRGTPEELREKIADAIGDLVIFLTGYCSIMGFDFERVVELTWEEVKKRDWQKNPTGEGY